eukprot:TRINITY_DN2004_c0_g2_i2.p2 TRINITY_DN2004_c0_g2~~TRINITY_DN2004_c0_g2_i2.p2  ORF type:complete len:103 (+),score=16.69 TRINITY_DN2004_c0_g2_i2:402-710(+)
MAALVCALQCRDTPSPFKFAVLISGFKSSDEAQQELFSQPISFPSLHVIGETDNVVPGSRLLADCFKDPVVYTHPGGHFVPFDKAMLEQLRVFLSPFQQKSS